MNFDSLLHWMSFKKSGTWANFRNTLQCISRVGSASDSAYMIRLRLSNFAYADFFDEYVSGVRVQKWSVRPPTLAGLADDNTALFCGFRNDELIERLISASSACDCKLQKNVVKNLPTEYRLSGDTEKFAILAALVGIEYVQQFALKQLTVTKPITALLREPLLVDAPSNWKTSSFSFINLDWLPGNADETVVEFQSKHASYLRISMLKVGRKYIQLDRFSTIYAAAYQQEVSLVDWNQEFSSLTCPVKARLPDPFERIACMASGQTPKVADFRRSYEGIPPEVARPLLVSLGQRCEFPTETTFDH